MTSEKYHKLQALLSGWFHQDFDIIGDSIVAVMDEYKKVSPDAEKHAVVAEIMELISCYGDKLDESFRREFDLEIEPTAFASTVEEFLMQIASELQSD